MGGWLQHSHKAHDHCWRDVSDSSGGFPKGHLLCKYGPREHYNQLLLKHNTAVLKRTQEAYKDRIDYFP